MKQKLQKMSAENLSLFGVQRKKGNMAGIFFNLLRKVVSKNSLSGKPGNTFNIEESGTQINNEPEFVITEKGYHFFHVVTSREKSKDITVMALRNAAGKLLPLFYYYGRQQENRISVMAYPQGQRCT